jgi:3-hydroxy-9,10-secoandrosta-1,3,5(10)-triene-9,17-dione monooxygenase reductase component
MNAHTGPGATRVDGVDFRRILGRFPTGVVVVSAHVDGRLHGMAVNSFSSVSLDPPLVSFCAAHSSTTWPKLRATDGFTVSILGAGHEDICRRFSRKDADRYGDGHGWRMSDAGHPVLADAIGWLECQRRTVYSAGDHDVVIGEVLDGAAADGGEPLVFFEGRFTTVRS